MGSLDAKKDYGAYSSSLKIASITENVTIAVGEGNTPVVLSAGNLAPAGSMIIGYAHRVIQAPGGGATVVDVGRTNGGNLDEFVNGASCAVLGETATWFLNHDATTLAPIINTAADTLTFTTDADVTGSDMILRVIVWYLECHSPQS